MFQQTKALGHVQVNTGVAGCVICASVTPKLTYAETKVESTVGIAAKTWQKMHFVQLEVIYLKYFRIHFKPL